MSSVSLSAQERMNTRAALVKCVLKLIMYHTCVNLPLTMISFPFFKLMGTNSKLPLPSWWVTW